MNRGIVYSAYGKSAQLEALHSIDSFMRVRNFECGIAVSSDDTERFRKQADVLDTKYASENGRQAKINADKWSPFENTLYLDADTRVNGNIEPIFQLLDMGFEFVATPSSKQGYEWLWHIDKKERILTAHDIGYTPFQVQGGVFAFRKTANVRKFFVAWRKAYKKYPNSIYDQAAMAYAFETTPMKAIFLGQAFNGGAIIAHRFGTIK